MYFLVLILFGILYALFVIAGTLLGIGSFLFFGGLATFFMVLQYLIGPKLVEFSMKVKHVSEKEAPKLHAMIADLAKKAGIPKPKVGISLVSIPNAFAYGRWRSDSRICVTQGILDLLTDEELKAVLGHEISHVKHRDVMIMTMIAVIPTIAWYIAYSTMFSRHDNNSGSIALLGIAAFVIYFITNLLVTYGSRIREYAADKGAVQLGEEPHHFASALYKLVYGNAKVSKKELKKIEGMKAFFASDPSRAHREILELKQVDTDLSGHIDKHELAALREKKVTVSVGDRLFEILSTHPNMVKRIQKLSSYT